MFEVDDLVDRRLKEIYAQLSQYLDSDIICYVGPLLFDTPDLFRRALSDLDKSQLKKLTIILYTTGGVIEPLESCVSMIRERYDTVDFVVPYMAMSAGTIFCMSGNNILMSPRASLGPIDPQVTKIDGTMVPAAGYLEQYKKLSEKSAQGSITPAELDLLRKLDLADLNFYEQAMNLTVSLLQKWLVSYKFQNWTKHQTNPHKLDQKVTPQDKQDRAEEIAKALGDVSRWHTHGRRIDMKTLREEIRLVIDDYTSNKTTGPLIDEFHDLILDYARKSNRSISIRARNWLM